MKAKDVLRLWSSWDFVDTFIIRETDENGRGTGAVTMTALDFMNSPLAKREIKCFGSMGKDETGMWRHHIEISNSAA